MRRWLKNLVELLKDWMIIYTWRSVWIVVACALCVVGSWSLLAFALGIPNEIVRPVSIWMLIGALMIGGATVDYVRKQQKRQR